MQTNAQANVADSPIQSEALKDNQFRVAGVVSVPHRLNAPIAEAP